MRRLRVSVGWHVLAVMAIPATAIAEDQGICAIDPSAAKVYQRLMVEPLSLASDQKGFASRFGFDFTIGCPNDAGDFRSAKFRTVCDDGTVACVAYFNEDTPYLYVSPGFLAWVADAGEVETAGWGVDLRCAFDRLTNFMTVVPGVPSTSAGLDLVPFLRAAMATAKRVRYERHTRLLRFESDHRNVVVRLSGRTDSHAFPIESILFEYPKDLNQKLQIANITRGSFNLFQLGSPRREMLKGRMRLRAGNEFSPALCQQSWDFAELSDNQSFYAASRKLLDLLPTAGLATDEQKHAWDAAMAVLKAPESNENVFLAAATISQLAQPVIDVAGRLPIETPDGRDLRVEHRRYPTASALEFRFGSDRYRAFQKLAVNRLFAESTPKPEVVALTVLLGHVGLTEDSAENRFVRDYQLPDDITFRRASLAVLRAHLGCASESDIAVLHVACRTAELGEQVVDHRTALISLAMADALDGLEVQLRKEVERSSDDRALDSFLRSVACTQTGQRVLVDLANQRRGQPLRAQILRHLAAGVDKWDAEFDNIVATAEEVAFDEEEDPICRFYSALIAAKGNKDRPFCDRFIRRALRGDQPELLLSLDEYLLFSERSCDFFPEFESVLESADIAVRIKAGTLFSRGTPHSHAVDDPRRWRSVVRKLFGDPDPGVQAKAAEALHMQQRFLTVGEFIPDLVRTIRNAENSADLSTMIALICRERKLDARQILPAINGSDVPDVRDSKWVQQNRVAVADAIERLLKSK